MLPNNFLTEFRSLPPRTSEKFFLRRDELYSSKVQSMLNRFGNKDVYLSIFAFEDVDNLDTCKIIGPMYLDFDGSVDSNESYILLTTQVKRVLSIFVNIWKIDKDMISIYFSGAKGFHVIIPPEILGIEPHKNLNEEYRNLALYLKTQFSADSIDTKIYDRRRIFRIENTINSKTDLYKVPITIRQLYQFSRDDMLRWARQPRNECVKPPKQCQTAITFYENIVAKNANSGIRRKPSCRKNLKDIPKKKYILGPCVKTMLQTGISKGNRNNICVMLASSLMQNGYQVTEVQNIIVEWNNKNPIPLPEKELLSTIDSAYKMLGYRNYGRRSYEDLGVCIGGKMSCSECKRKKKAGVNKHG